MTKEELQKEMALFRFSLIAPVVAGTFREPSQMEYFRQTATKEHLLPTGKSVRFSPLTIKKWFLLYQKGGLDSLIPKARMDLGGSRVLTSDMCEQIKAYKEQFPYITGKKIYEKMIQDGYLKEHEISVDSIYRFLKNEHLTRDTMPPVECLAFEMEHANDCWQADTTVGPVITVNGSRRQTYLIAFIDDASRIITHGEFFFADNAVNMQIAFKKAILKYGVPKRLFVDNGCSYQNNQLKWICAELGIVKIHSKPYKPQGKAKIERSHRTIKDKWINAIDWNDYTSLEQLNTNYQEFLNKEYTNFVHSTLGETPKQRYLKDFHLLKFQTDEELEEHFLHRITRKVTPTATISLFRISYEVPQHYIGLTIPIRYHAEDLSEIYIYDGVTNKRLHCCYPIKKLDNANRKRKANISYSQMDGGTAYV